MKKLYTYPAKPFVKWVGGKTQLLDDIKKFLPSDLSQRNDVTYIEPFVGGGAVLFWILQEYPNITKAIINDINEELETKDLDYFKFVWFTDGCGWRSAKNNLKETFDVLEHLYNIADLESGIISKVLI